MDTNAHVQKALEVNIAKKVWFLWSFIYLTLIVKN